MTDSIESEPLTTGQFLRRRLKERGLTVKDLSVRLNVARSHLSEVVNDHRSIGICLTVRVSEILEIDPEELAALQARRQIFEYKKSLAGSRPGTSTIPSTRRLPRQPKLETTAG